MTKIEGLLENYQRAAADLVAANGLNRIRAKQQYEAARDAFSVELIHLDSETKTEAASTTRLMTVCDQPGRSSIA